MNVEDVEANGNMEDDESEIDPNYEDHDSDECDSSSNVSLYWTTVLSNEPTTQSSNIMLFL